MTISTSEKLLTGGIFPDFLRFVGRLVRVVPLASQLTASTDDNNKPCISTYFDMTSSYLFLLASVAQDVPNRAGVTVVGGVF